MHPREVLPNHSGLLQDVASRQTHLQLLWEDCIPTACNGAFFTFLSGCESLALTAVHCEIHVDNTHDAASTLLTCVHPHSWPRPSQRPRGPSEFTRNSPQLRWPQSGPRDPREIHQLIASWSLKGILSGDDATLELRNFPFQNVADSANTESLH